MFKSISLGFGLLSLVAFAGCDAGDNTEPKEDEKRVLPMPTLPAFNTVDGPVAPGSTFAGETAAQFYGNMTYTPPVSEDKVGQGQFVLIADSQQIPLTDPLLLDKDPRQAQIRIYLRADKTYVVLYRETDKNKLKTKKEAEKNKPEAEQRKVPPFEVALSSVGEWSITNTTLDLFGFGRVETGATTTTRYGDTYRTVNLLFTGELTPVDLVNRKEKFTALVTKQTPEKAIEELKKDAKAISEFNEVHRR